jgi:hypothetical protein
MIAYHAKRNIVHPGAAGIAGTGIFGCMATSNGMYNVPGILPAMNIT